MLARCFVLILLAGVAGCTAFSEELTLDPPQAAQPLTSKSGPRLVEVNVTQTSTCAYESDEALHLKSGESVLVELDMPDGTTIPTWSCRAGRCQASLTSERTEVLRFPVESRVREENGVGHLVVVVDQQAGIYECLPSEDGCSCVYGAGGIHCFFIEEECNTCPCHPWG